MECKCVNTKQATLQQTNGQHERMPHSQIYHYYYGTYCSSLTIDVLIILQSTARNDTTKK